MPRRNTSSMLRRGLAELLIVVVGVLIALWADQLRQSRSDRQDEAVQLEALREDFLVTASVLDSALAELDAQEHSLQRLIAGGFDGESPDSVNAWARMGLWVIVQASPRLSTLRDLQASGRLGIVQSRELRYGLAELDRILELGAIRHADFTTIQVRIVDPVLVQGVNLPRFFLGDESRPADFEPLVEFLDSPEARNVIATKLSQVPFERGPRAEARAQVDRLLELIDERLDQLGRGAG